MPQTEVNGYNHTAWADRVSPSGIDGFSWDDIFRPNGLDETHAEMGDEYKPEFSMRTQAFKKLAEYITNGDIS